MGRSWAMAGAVIAASLTFSASESFAFSCVRHFYNHAKSCSWKVKARPDRGNVYFTYSTCTQGRRPVVQGRQGALACKQKNGPCTVPDYCTVSMEFTYSSARTSGWLDIYDGKNKQQSFYYDTTRGLNQCPYIIHEGNTGGASVNDPANADVQAWQCSW